MSAAELPFVVVLLIVAWLTAGGMAVRSVSRIWLRHWAERRLRGAAAALTYLERPQRLLAAAGAGVAFTLILAGILLGVRVGGGRLAWELAVLAAVIIFCGQMLPRVAARRWAAPLIPVLLPVLRAAEIVASPVLFIGRAIVRRLESPSMLAAEDADRDVIHDLLREGEIEGVGEHDEIAIISGVVAFGEKTAQDIMTSRAELFAVELTTDARALASAIAQSGYSRVPIFVGSIDRIVGMVHAFDVFKLGADAVPTLRPVTEAPALMPLNDLLFRMLRGRQHIAIVRDDSGHTLGIVTLEDILEELVGDIQDEHDEPHPAGASTQGHDA